MKKSYFLLIVFLIWLSCTNLSKPKQIDGQPAIAHSECDSCKGNTFYKCISEYLAQTSLGSDEPIFQGVYFFRKNGCDYFTIWINFILPHIYMDLDNGTRFDHTYLNIPPHHIVLINPKDVDISKVIKGCEKFIKDISEAPKPSDIIWDDSSYPETFRYEFIDGKFEFFKTDKPIIDFFPEDMIEYEEYIGRQKGRCKRRDASNL